jgi:hypothetical protein
VLTVALALVGLAFGVALAWLTILGRCRAAEDGRRGSTAESVEYGRGLVLAASVILVSLIFLAKPFWGERGGADEAAIEPPPRDSAPELDEVIEGGHVRIWARSDPENDRFCFRTLLSMPVEPGELSSQSVEESGCADFESRAENPFLIYLGPDADDGRSIWIVVADERITELDLVVDGRTIVAHAVAPQLFAALMGSTDVPAVQFTVLDDGEERRVTCSVINPAAVATVTSRACDDL